MAKAPSIFQRATRLGLLRDIHTVKGSPTQGLRDWLFSETYAFQKTPTRKQFEIFVPSVGPMLQSYAYDANRMSCGAFETILSISPVEAMRRSLAWLTIQLYYASFFSAHAFLRMQGVSCTQLDNREAGRLGAISQAYGFPPGSNISSGFHVIFFDEVTKRLQFMHSVGGGGSHEVLWGEYLKGLKVLEDRVAKAQFLNAEIGAITAKLASVRRILCLDGSKNGNWPSRVRNDINYRHGSGVWWPHSSGNNVDHYVGLIRSSLACDPLENVLEESTSLEAFVRVCLFVVNLTRITVLDMASLDPDNQSFQEAGPMVVLRRGRLVR